MTFNVNYKAYSVNNSNKWDDLGGGSATIYLFTKVYVYMIDVYFVFVYNFKVPFRKILVLTWYHGTYIYLRNIYVHVYI